MRYVRATDRAICTLFRSGREGAVTKAIATIALGAASLGLVAQPAVAAPPTAIFAKVADTLEAHTIAPCEPQDWSAEMRFAHSFYASPKYAREERDRRIRRVIVAGRACPERDAFASEDDWLEAFDGLVAVTVYKSTKLRNQAIRHYKYLSYYIYAYGKLTLIHLGPYPSPELQTAFVAAMKDLNARQVSEYKLD